MWFSFFITWEQRKLGKEVEITMGQSPDGSTYRETPAKYILVQGNADLKDGWVFPRVWTMQKTKTAEAGDLIMSVRAPAGAMGKTAYNVVLGRGVAAIKGNEFIFQALVKMDSDGYWKKLAAGSTFESINSDTVSNAVIYVPQENNEQCKLGEYFNSLDNLITLHQRKGKCRFYQVLWKILSSKMTIYWEQRKFGEYFEERNERSGEGELISVTINSGIKKFNELGRFDSKPEDLSKYKRVEVGDIAYNSMRMWQGASGYSPYAGILSPAYTVITPKNGISSLFFAYLIKRPPMIHLFEINSQGLTSDTWNLKFPAFSQIEASAPFSVEEQDRIAELFGILDKLITLHQRKQNIMLTFKKCHFYVSVWQHKTTTWEQRKVQDVAERYDNLRVPVAANLRVHGNIPYYGANGIQDYVDGFTHDGEFVLVAEDGANDLKNYPVQHVKGRIWVNNHAHVLQGKSNLMDNLFLAYSLHCADMASYLVGGSRAKLNADTLMTRELLLPSVVEQAKIGRLLDSIDNLITLHQRGKKHIGEIKNDKRNKTE